MRVVVIFSIFIVSTVALILATLNYMNGAAPEMVASSSATYEEMTVEDFEVHMERVREAARFPTLAPNAVVK